MIPFRVAVTVAVCPDVALELTVPVDPLIVNIEVFELFHCTELVMSCCWLLPENVPIAVKVTVDPAATVVAEDVIVIAVRLPG